MSVVQDKVQEILGGTVLYVAQNSLPSSYNVPQMLGGAEMKRVRIIIEAEALPGLLDCDTPTFATLIRARVESASVLVLSVEWEAMK